MNVRMVPVAFLTSGADGPSQMALEDLAMFRAIPGSTVFYPSDVVAVERAVELAANTKGMCFIRGARTATPVVYTKDSDLQIGKAQVMVAIPVLSASSVSRSNMSSVSRFSSAPTPPLLRRMFDYTSRKLRF